MLMNERVWKDFIRFFVVKVAPFATSILSLYFLASSSPNKGDVFGSEFFVCINPFALRALPLYSFQEHRGRGGTSIISTEGLFKISPRRHAPQLSPIFCCVPPAMLRGTAGKKWNHTEFSFGFISDIKKRYPIYLGYLLE